MNRDYNSGVNESAIMFAGSEVEHTPAYKMSTLFVVGCQNVADIKEMVVRHGFQHIYFGANMSFPKIVSTDYTEWEKWQNMIAPFLNEGYICTLDINVDQVDGLLETGLTEFNNFIPMISVKLPYIQQLGYNATIKLDDKDFNSTNPGVWCHSVHSLMDRTKFTSWNQYTQDEILK